jgi:DnaA family protein
VTGQLPLALGRPEPASFESCHPGERCEGLAAARRLVEAPPAAGFLATYLWGPSGVGKSHLLHAACRAAAEAGRTAGLVSPADPDLAPAALDGLAGLGLVCVDDLGAAAGLGAWESALFRLYNEVEARGGRLLLAAPGPPGGCGLVLPDLASRLGAALVVRLHPPDEQTRRAVLGKGARARGFELPEEVVDYLLARVPRDLSSLQVLLDRLDEVSLAERRPVTVPLVRKLLGNGPDRS